MTPTKFDGEEGRSWPRSAHEARRFFQNEVPQCLPVEGLPTDGQRYSTGDEPPDLVTPELLEDDVFQAIRVADPRSIRGHSGFAAFLDGTQDVRVVTQIEGISVVWATVSAAIRTRVNRRLVCWNARGPIVESRYYIPFRYVPALHAQLRDHPRVVDTARADSKGNFPSRHPAALIEATIKRVQNDRERIEQELAELWCRSEEAVLYVDGSITGSAIAAASERTVGVIKSHRRLYAEGDAFNVLVRLEAGERTSLFRVAPEKRHAVASWYVRLRGVSGRDALFGLVRVEAALGSDISRRADEISRWIVAEGVPLALPDGRWDKMAYGIRDTEEFLRAIS